MNSWQVAYQVDVRVEVYQKVRGAVRRVLENQIPNAGGQLWTVGEALREQAKEEHNGR